MVFDIVAAIGFKEAYRGAKPVLLESVMDVEEVCRLGVSERKRVEIERVAERRRSRSLGVSASRAARPTAT